MAFMDLLNLIDADVEEALFQKIAEKRLPFDLFLRGGRVGRQVRLKEKRGRYLYLNTAEKIDLGEDVVSIRFTGRALRGFLSILKELGVGKTDKQINLYPYGRRRQKKDLIATSPYHFIVAERNRSSIEILPKISIVAFSILNYPDSLIEDGTPSSEIVGGKWRDEWRELVKLISKDLRREVKKRDSLFVPITLIARDGREIKGEIRRKWLFLSGAGQNFVKLRTVQNGKKKFIHVFKHAIEDYYIG